ncbi:MULTISPECIES: hypothetical protein [unclassified Streptococcus]|uniref:hypothetical protein n=1 Tax=unclassified Streptococcus TaxID=2608887 RepID=UPI0020C8C860|nr:MULTISPECIES: hypothetical protein [unclassified Streptococcus]MCP9060982.1 hypothetical protein [Streptococcus sp. CF7_Ac1-12]MCP9085394.1 hypothetical protein [Streptococcus sp. CF7_Ac1-8]
MNLNGSVSDLFIFLIKFTLMLTVFYFYFKNINRNKLRNPYFRSIDRILSKYYSGYFFKFYDLQYYPDLKFIYRNLLFEFNSEGIFPETLESYIKTEIKKSSYIKKSLALVIAFFGGKELNTLITNFNSISTYINFENIGIFKINNLSSLLANPEIRDILLVCLAILISFLFIFVVLLLDNTSFIRKHSLNKQGKHIIEDVIAYYKNYENKENFNSNDFVFTDEYISLLYIRIIKIENMYIINFPKKLIEKRSKHEWNIENVRGRLDIPNVLLNNQKYTFIFKRESENSIPRLDDVRFQNGTSVTTVELEKLKKIFEILFLGSEIEYNKFTSVEKMLYKFTVNKEHPNMWNKVIKYLKYVILIVGTLLFLFLLIIVGIFIFRDYLFYTLVTFYLLFKLAHSMVKKLFS